VSCEFDEPNWTNATNWAHYATNLRPIMRLIVRDSCLPRSAMGKGDENCVLRAFSTDRGGRRPGRRGIFGPATFGPHNRSGSA